jgi:hypothetical protein
MLSEKSTRSDNDHVSPDAALYAAAGKGLEIGDSGEFYALLFCAANDCTG